ncbi:hypothetical protein HDU97_010156 [Phlyctochytrium planicorne]|nr:hypothetical protein HDU97_010156 [Phlyctochytrium planicorne]
MPSARRRAVLKARKQNKTVQKPASSPPKQTTKPVLSVEPVKPEQIESIVEALVAEPTKIDVPVQITPAESAVTSSVEKTASSSPPSEPALTNPSNPIESQVQSTPSPPMSRNRMKKLKAKAKRDAQHAAETSAIDSVTPLEESASAKCEELGVVADHESRILAQCEEKKMHVVVEAQAAIELKAAEESAAIEKKEAAPEVPAVQANHEVVCEIAMESPADRADDIETAPDEKKAPAAEFECKDGEVAPNSEEKETAPETQTAKTVLREDSGKALDDGFEKNEEVAVEECIENVNSVETEVIDHEVTVNAIEEDGPVVESPQPSLHLEPALPVDSTQPTQLVFQNRPIDPIYLAYLQSNYPTLSLHQLQVFGDYVCPGCPYDHEHGCDQMLRVPPGRAILFSVMTSPLPEISIHTCPTPRNHVDPAWPIPVEHHDFFKNLHEVEVNGQVVGMCTGLVNVVPKRYLKELWKSPLHGQTVVDDILEFNGEPKMDQKSHIVENAKVREESVEMACSEYCAADHSCTQQHVAPVYPTPMVDYIHQYVPEWFQYGQQPINASFYASQPPAGLRPLCPYRELCTIEGCQQFHPRKPCRFFPNCRNGDNCMYMHPPQNPQMQPCYANPASGYEGYAYYPQQFQAPWTNAPTYHNAAPFSQPNHQANSRPFQHMNTPQYPPQASAIPTPASTNPQYGGKTLCSLREECPMVNCPLFHPRKNGKKCLYKHAAAAEPETAN